MFLKHQQKQKQNKNKIQPKRQEKQNKTNSTWFIICNINYLINDTQN